MQVHLAAVILMTDASLAAGTTARQISTEDGIARKVVSVAAPAEALPPTTTKCRPIQLSVAALWTFALFMYY